MINILTVDVEDWQQATLDYNNPISQRAMDNTSRLLDILAEHGTHATFFVQTMVAEKYPHLIRRIAAEGHEIASHGHRHIPLFNQTPGDFAQDLRASLDILGELGFDQVHGYRAPDFSIRQDTLWALDILLEHGIRYSSSIFPFRGSRYGIAGVARQPHQFANGLAEIPLSVVEIAGRNWPVAGGGYLRLLPYAMTRWAIRRINSEQRPAVVYVHPYELDCDEMGSFRGQIPWRLYVSQGLNRHKTASKLHSLLRDFEFAPIGEVVRS